MAKMSQSKYERPIDDPAVEQDPRVQEGLERFRHHDKTEHPPTDTEMGKTPARDSGTRQAEHQEKRKEEYGQNPLMQPTERRVKDAKKQADGYGRQMNVPQTLPQTLLEAQDNFGASGDSDAKESREKVSLFPLVERQSERQSN